MEKHFKEGTLLGKLFNRNTVKIGYARTSNMKEIITGQNIKLLNPKPPPPPIPPPPPTIVIQPPSSVLDPVQSQDSIAEEASTATNKRCSCERRRKVCPVVILLMLFIVPWYRVAKETELTWDLAVPHFV